MVKPDLQLIYSIVLNQNALRESELFSSTSTKTTPDVQPEFSST